MEKNNSKKDDHDILIEVSVKLDRALDDIAKLGRNFYTDVQRLESEKLNKTEFDTIKFDHEGRLRKLERYVWGAIAVLTVGQCILLILATIHSFSL